MPSSLSCQHCLLLCDPRSTGSDRIYPVALVHLVVHRHRIDGLGAPPPVIWISQ